MFAMTPGNCCCFCESCCNGTAPTEFEIELQLGNNQCSVCESDLSGTYVLTRNSSACLWEYDTGYQWVSEPPSWNIKDPADPGAPVTAVPCFYPFDSMVPWFGCNPPYDAETGILRIAIKLEVYCISATQVIANLFIRFEGVWDAETCDEYASCFLPNVNTYSFSKVFDLDGFDCSEINLEEMTLNGVCCFCWSPNAWVPTASSGPNAPCQGDAQNRTICRTTTNDAKAWLSAV